MAGRVSLQGLTLQKAGQMVDVAADIKVAQGKKYVSRGGDKLESVVSDLGIDFENKTILDVGSSTGGFTDYALQHGAAKVYCVDVGTNQLDQKLRNDPRVVVMEQTDIRMAELPEKADIAIIDVSFISLINVLPSVTRYLIPDPVIIALAKPQFEASKQIADRHRGVIKDESVRSQILADLEVKLKDQFEIIKSADSKLAGAHGNVERFYLLKPKS